MIWQNAFEPIFTKANLHVRPAYMFAKYIKHYKSTFSYFVFTATSEDLVIIICKCLLSVDFNKNVNVFLVEKSLGTQVDL